MLQTLCCIMNIFNLKRKENEITMRHSTPTTQRKRSNPKSETEDDVVYSKLNPYKISELIKRSKWIQENSEKTPIGPQLVILSKKK